MTCLFHKLYKSFVTMVVFFVQINRSFCETYDGSNQGHTSVPTNIPSGITIIILYENEISRINDESFGESYTNFSTVEELHLDTNQIENVSERAFVGFDNVKEIYLYSNQLRHIQFNVEDIPQLEHLDLEDNRLAQIPTFYGFFQSLRALYLAENLISHVYGEAFENITNINTIDLASNYLVIFESEQELSSLSHFYLNSNELTEIPALKGTYNLIYIDIRDNEITVECFLTLRERINGSEHSITKLLLGRNEDLVDNMLVVVNFLEQFTKLTQVRFLSSKFHCDNLCWMRKRG